jgi:hypothetical protein
MSSNGRPEYDLRQVARATEQLKRLAETAVQQGIKAEYIEVLKSIVAKLQSKPKQAGDPERRLKKPGSVMYHAVFGPLFVQYAVFEPEKIVLILKVAPMPNSALDVP